MREIKFRCYDSKTTTMHYDVGYWDGIIFEELPYYGEESGWDGFQANTDTHMIEQYTGLKDKNGKEIYEGDIIQANQYPFFGDDNLVELNYLGVVGIDPDGVYYELHVVSGRVSGRACGGNLSEINTKNLEIIGNIHENPELLEQ